MILDTKKYELRYGLEGYKQDVWKLTKTEMKILKLLSDNEVHTKEQIFKRCNFNNDNTTRNAIHRLRKRINELDIKSIVKVGYRLDTLIKVQ